MIKKYFKAKALKNILFKIRKAIKHLGISLMRPPSKRMAQDLCEEIYKTLFI